MIHILFAITLPTFLLANLLSGPATPPPQPQTGPGSSTYKHEQVTYRDFADEAEGYWLFEPASPSPDSAHVVVFIHGYGGYNPMIYGAWINHLVKKGNIVIYPRYQKNILSPHPDKFAENTAIAIRDAIDELNKDGHVKPILSKLALIGHSYGGVITSELAIHFEKYNIPPVKAALLCAPGSGKFKGGRLDSYEKMPEDLLLLIVTHDNDWVVGDEFAVKVFNEATSVKNRNLLYHYGDEYGDPEIKADHNQAYAIDMTYDTGVRNYTSRKALRVAQVDPVDYYGYWKLFDAMSSCLRDGQFCEHAFGGSAEQASLGEWSDGKPVRPFEIILPESSNH